MSEMNGWLDGFLRASEKGDEKMRRLLFNKFVPSNLYWVSAPITVVLVFHSSLYCICILFAFVFYFIVFLFYVIVLYYIVLYFYFMFFYYIILYCILDF